MAEQIKIDADVSGVLGAVDKLKTAAQGLHKTLGGADISVRTDQAQKSLSSLTATAEAARKALQAAGSAFDLDASDQAQAVDELRAALEDIAKLAVGGIDLRVDTSGARAQIESLRRELQQRAGSVGSGAGGAGGASMDAERRRALREEREERNRRRRTEQGQGRPGAGGPGAPPPPGAGPGSGPAPGGAGQPPESFFARLGRQLRSDPQTGRLGRVTGAAGGIAGGLMSGSGSGGMMRSIGGGMGTLGGAAIGTLIGGPLGAVVGGLAGSLLGSVGGSAGGKMDEAVGDVMTEGLDLSNLQRSIGSTNAGFGELQHRLREASGGLQTTFVEMAKYGQQFARQANYRGDASELAEEVKNALGYARGFGADPQAGLQFSASMRHTQASKSDQDSRKIGLSVAEAIGRGGLGPKTDEVLSAIGNFANQAANSALTAPDVSSFASVLGTASATGIAGLAGNPANAAAIVGQADSAMRQGGAFGQASSVLTDIALRKQGMNFGDVNLLKEQGLFGTEKDAFGTDSAVQKSMRAKIADTSGGISEAEKAQLRAELARYEGLAANSDGRTNADKVMGRLREMSPDQTQYRESLKSHFGLKTASQAEAFDAVMRTHGGTGALSRRLEEAGVDTKSLNALSIGGMSEAAVADRTGLQRMGNDILKDKEFSSKNRDLADKLRDALGGGDTEALRNALFLAKEKGAGNMTEIERANQAAIDLKNEFMKYAQAILPAVTAAKDGILALVEKLAPDSDFAKQAKAEREMIRQSESGDADERKKQAGRAAQMVAEGKAPITQEVAKLAREGSASVGGDLDRRAAEFEGNAEKAKNSWFFPGYRSKNLQESARKLREQQANLKGGAFDAAQVGAGKDVTVPAGASPGKAIVPAPSGAAAPVPAPAAAPGGAAAPVPAPAAAPSGAAAAAPKPSKRALENWPDAAPHLVSASQQAGVDPGVVAKIAHFESGFRPHARPVRRDGTRISSAHGYGQFLNGTWTDTLNRHGAKYGIEGAGQLTSAQAAQYRDDKGIQAAMLAEFTRENIEKGRKHGGSDDDANVYAFHNLGDGDAGRLLSGMKRDPHMSVRNALLREGAPQKERDRVEAVIRGNPSLYGDGSVTAGDAYGRMGAVMRRGEHFAAEARAPAPAPTAAAAAQARAPAPTAAAAAQAPTAAAAAQAPAPAANPFAALLSSVGAAIASLAAPAQTDLQQPIPTGGKDGPGAAASGAAPGGQQAVKVITEIVVRDHNGKERDDVQARPLSYESLPAGVPA